MIARQHPLGQFAKAGFQDLSAARSSVTHLSDALGLDVTMLLTAFASAADPDVALQKLNLLCERHQNTLAAWDKILWIRAATLVGASPALGDFFVRNPQRLTQILAEGGRLISAIHTRDELLSAVGADPHSESPVSSINILEAPTRLRVRYRELLAQVMLHDLLWGQGADHHDIPKSFDGVADSLSNLAEGALEAALAISRSAVVSGQNGIAVSEDRVRSTRLSVIAMGKCGANELNVVSDVDVMFIAEPKTDSELDTETLIRVASRLATELMRAIQEPGAEPPLWQVDPNLRPEGRQGALVRTLGSMLNYYERWAKTWEFQALLKARAIAGDRELGENFVKQTRDMVWASGSREDFVGSVQRMRERVTEHIALEDVEHQIKLGPGGLRDIEFSVQLLQLVHGQRDDSLHHRGTLPALEALVAAGYVARSDGERLAAHYRVLRLLEHRLQLRDLRRTALMPRDHESLRILARSTFLAKSADELLALWHRVKREVRDLHLKIFYAPLLSAVAVLPESELALTGEQARSRLESIGFRDPDGALRHLVALTKGTSRAAKIQRNILPVMLRWFAEGTDPDFGLVSFRRISEAHYDTPWYLRLLRDGSEAAERLAKVLSTSRFTSELLESFPEAVAWLEHDELLKPAKLKPLLDEMRSLASRRPTVDAAAAAMRAVHRREVLRLALGRLTLVLSDGDVASGLDAAHTALLDGLLLALGEAEEQQNAMNDSGPPVRLTLIGMGRYGGSELGFASDIDVIAVLKVAEGATQNQSERSVRSAVRQVSELRRLVSDPRFSVDLDFDLRPEGKNGPLVRSLEAYQNYYQRWSVTWEAQALLRARVVAGDEALGQEFLNIAGPIRYPAVFSDDSVREVRRIKARVEAERLPKGADPSRHLKLGPGGISDVEWLVQLIQLQHGAVHPQLRTVSTLEALNVAVELELLAPEDAEQLSASWKLASSIRSAVKLWSGKSLDSLPRDRNELEGITGVLGMAPGSTGELEEMWLGNARRSRAIFERVFFGYEPLPV